MITVKLSDAMKGKRKKIVEAMESGKIIIYPTDTIYGIGCTAEMIDSVKKIRNAKKRDDDKPFSVIAPSVEWIESNTSAMPESVAFAKTLLPGPYTVIMKAKPSAPKPVVTKDKTIGVRIPDCEFTKLVKEANIPFVTTSVNITGEEFLKNLKDLPKEIAEYVDIAIDAGKIDGMPSRVFDLTGNGIKILRY